MVPDKLLPSIALIFILALNLVFSCLPISAYALEITPFYAFNQSPLVQIFGIPAAESALVLEKGRLSGLVAVDVVSNFAEDADADREDIVLDGEIYRTTLALRYGVGKGVEVGLDVPYLAESGGFLDNAIEGWHDFFDIDQAGRDQVPHGRLLFRYVRDGIEKFKVDHANGGFGDLRLTGAVQICRDESRPGRGMALRALLKVPTGNSTLLHGSGSTDLALWLSAADDHRFSGGRFTVFGAAGGMTMTKGDVLREIQRKLAAFATLGVGWSSWERLALKAQLNANTPFYRGSVLRELSVISVQVVAGGTVALSPKTSLDISFAEDLLVLTASPDIVFSLALRRQF